MSVVKRTTFCLKPSTSSIRTGSLHDKTSISPRSLTTFRNASSIGSRFVVKRIASPASAFGGITFNAAPPSIVPMLTVVSPKKFVVRKFRVANVFQNVEQLFDRRIAFFGIRRMCGLSASCEVSTETFPSSRWPDRCRSARR